jgi:deaminated glutathione amidase
MSIFTIAGLQLEGQRGSNVDSMIEEIDTVKRRFPWVQMVLAGELNAFGARVADAESLPNAIEQRFADAAARNQVWLIPGTMYERVGSKVYNTASVIDPSGNVVTRYRKIFPFCPYEQNVTPGNELCTFEVPGAGRFGLAICYDMWFPELVRSLALSGAEVILHPSMTSTLDRDVEVAIARANAAINQVYFVSINVADRLGCGESCVYGPGGELIHRAGRTREIIPVELDLDYLRRVRRTGWQRLGQPLKSLRDSTMDFSPHLSVESRRAALRELGPLQMARQSSPVEGL